MKTQNILLIPIAFVAGIVSLVLLQRGGMVDVNLSSTTEQHAPGAVAPEQTSSEIAVSRSADATTDAALSNQHLSERIDDLQQQLRSATLNADMMRSKIDALEQQIDTAAIGTEFLPDGQSATGSLGEVPVGESNRPSNPMSRFSSPDNDVQVTSLISAGVDPQVAEQIKQRSDQWTLRRLELVDQATREGWRRSDQFDEQITALREERPSIREELGDENYDRYLFASGETNRVQISSIIDGSAAQIAGMENGDVVLSYANNRVFSTRDLQRATSEGTRGEPVQVDVLRLDQPLNIEIPSGPMGVTLIGKRVEPQGF